MITDFLRAIVDKIDNLTRNKKLFNGHNGPYRDNETDIRKISHLLVLYSNILKSGIKEIEIEQIKNLKKELITSKHYKGKAYFRSRIKPGKDEVNGVIGIAWVIEGLCAAYEVLQEQEIIVFLEETINSLKFNNTRGLWERPVYSPENKSGVDETFNHQLWLAYAILYYTKISKKNIPKEVKIFFNKFNSNFRIHKDGLIKHNLKNTIGLKNQLKELLKEIRKGIKSLIKGRTTRYKESGYHLFNMFAFARMEDLGFGELFIHSGKFHKALTYSFNENLYLELSSNREDKDYYLILPQSLLKYNRYGFPYNVSGFEFSYLNKVFKLNKDELADKYIKKQLDIYGLNNLNFDFEKEMETEDKINFLLRSYELSFIL